MLEVTPETFHMVGVVQLLGLIIKDRPLLLTVLDSNVSVPFAFQ